METKRTLWSAVVVMLAAGLNSSAGMLDLTTEGASGVINGATFSQAMNIGPTGTGNFDPFVRIEKPKGSEGIERAYNTEGVTEWQTKDDNQWTHAIQIKDIPIVDGKYEFRLDINQDKGGDGGLLSLDELKIHVVDQAIGGSLTDYETNPAFGPADWEMGVDNWIKLNYALESGSGDGDLLVFIPVSDLGTTGTDYLYLYSTFGVHFQANAGFEEWGVAEVPEPATIVLLALSGLMLRKRRKV